MKINYDREVKGHRAVDRQIGRKKGYIDINNLRMRKLHVILDLQIPYTNFQRHTLEVYRWQQNYFLAKNTSVCELEFDTKNHHL